MQWHTDSIWRQYSIARPKSTKFCRTLGQKSVRVERKEVFLKKINPLNQVEVVGGMYVGNELKHQPIFGLDQSGLVPHADVISNDFYETLINECLSSI